VRDGIALSLAGHPTVVFVHDVFREAARAQARALGMPDLTFYVFPQHAPGISGTGESAEAAKAVEGLPSLFQQ